MSERLTPAQIRAARAMLNWSREELAKACGLTAMTISRLETGSTVPQSKTDNMLRRCFTERDIRFLPGNGVAQYREEIDKLTGPNALSLFLDDVYETVKDGGSICVTGTDEDLYSKYHHEEVEGAHEARMTAVKDKVSFRVILKYGDSNFYYNSYVSYKWMPEGKFRDNPFYVYNNKLAFIKMAADGPEVWRINMPSMAAAFRDLFDVVWEQCLPPARGQER